MVFNFTFFGSISARKSRQNSIETFLSRSDEKL